MPIERLLEERIAWLLRESPAVALLGPRQSGKTTLATSLVASRGGHFFDLELESDRLRLDVEWEERTRARRLGSPGVGGAHPAPLE